MSEIALIIPCYNHGRTIGETLESVRLQTRPPAEVVIVDDGSTHLQTRHVLFALGAAGYHVIHTENRGVAAARNHGIRLTSAPYIVLLDADDLLEPTYLEKTAGRLDQKPAIGFVSTAIQAFGAASYVWTPPPCTLPNALARGTVHPATMFRRVMWEAVGGVDETFRTCEDLDFWIAAMEAGFEGEVLDEPLFRYRVRDDSKHRDDVRRGTYRETKLAVLTKHRQTVEVLGTDLVRLKEEFVAKQEAHREDLQTQTRGYERELQQVEGEIATLSRMLREQGQDHLDWGDLRRLTPLSPIWGLERGKIIDRYYIEAFLAKHRGDIRGRVLDVKDSFYSRTYGSAVTHTDVLDIDPCNPDATVVADLTRAEEIPTGTFDCFVLLQTLHIIHDVRAALFHAHRILKPGGVLLCTLPAVSRVNNEGPGLDGGDYWRFTEAAVRELFYEFFPLERFDVSSFGNVMTGAGFLYGLSTDDLVPEALQYDDPWFPLVFCVRAVKPEEFAANIHPNIANSTP